MASTTYVWLLMTRSCGADGQHRRWFAAYIDVMVLHSGFKLAEQEEA